MDDKQCEIMTSFEDVFGCGSRMRGKKKEQELVFMYVCGGAFQKKKKGGGGGGYLKGSQICVCVWIGATYDSFLQCV